MLFKQIAINFSPRNPHTAFVSMGKHISSLDVSGHGEVPGFSSTRTTIVYLYYVFTFYLQVFQSNQSVSSMMLSNVQTEKAF